MIKPVEGLLLENQPDPIIWRFLVWSEARGEPLKGQLAVLWVAHNRAKRSGQTMKKEILRPLQFSAFNENDPNRNKMLGAWMTSPESWLRADAVCELFEDCLTTDPVNGATHYYVPAIVRPSWGRGHPDWIDKGLIGNHVFGIAG